MHENIWKRIYQNVGCDFFGGQEILKKILKKRH